MHAAKRPRTGGGPDEEPPASVGVDALSSCITRALLQSSAAVLDGNQVPGDSPERQVRAAPRGPPRCRARTSPRARRLAAAMPPT